jgi:hypothetical protein
VLCFEVERCNIVPATSSGASRLAGRFISCCAISARQRFWDEPASWRQQWSPIVTGTIPVPMRIFR